MYIHIICDSYSLPSQLAKENRKFIYKVVKSGARAREYEDSLLWLEEAGLVYRVSGKSLSVYHKKFNPDLRIRFSLNNLQSENGFINTPPFMEDWAKRLIELYS